MPYVIKRKIKKYYKLTYAQWIQPVMTANIGSNFIVSASSQANTDYAPWKSFKSVTTDTYCWASSGTPTSSLPQIYQWFSPDMLKINSITIKNRSPGLPQSMAQFRLQGSDDNVHWEHKTEVLFNTNNTAGATWTITPTINVDKPYKYHRLVIWAKNGTESYVCLGYPTINAQVVTSMVESTADDYNYSEIVYEDYAVKRKTRHYYKSQVNVDSPVYTSQAQATSGVNGVKLLTAQQYWYITHPTQMVGHIPNNTVVTMDVGNNNGLNTVGYHGAVQPGAAPSVIMTNVQCSADNVNWVTIASSFGDRNALPTSPLNIPKPNNYRYLRFTVKPDDTGFANCAMYAFRINYISVPRQEVSSTDNYDAYIDDVVPYAVKRKQNNQVS